MKKIAFGLIFAIMISGCHNRQALWMSDFSVGPEDVVAELEWLHLPSDSIGCPSMIVKVGDRIILSDSSNGYALKVYDMTNDSVMSMLRIGRAEDEVLNVHQMLSYGGNLGIFDNFSKKLLLIKLEEGRIYSKFDIPVFSSIAIQNDTVVGLLSDGSGRYGRYCLDSGLFVDSFMDFSEYGLSNVAGGGLCQGHVLVDGTERLGWFGYYVAADQIINYKKKSVIKSDVFETPSFNNHGQKYVAMTPESKVAFISVSGNDDKIYALYDGKEMSYYMRNRGETPYGNTICVFDWNGKPIERYVSSLPVSCIYVDGHNLYACVLTGDSEYRLGILNLRN